MDSQLENSITYLTKRLSETDARPELHLNLRLLYQKYLSLVEHYPESLTRLTLNVFPILKAEKFDRHRAYMDLYRRLENKEGENIHRQILEKLKAVTNFQDIKRLKRLGSEDFDWHDERRKTLFELCSHLVDYKRAATSEQGELKMRVKQIWQKFKALDPDISWQRIREYSPYRYCLYYDEVKFKILGETLEEALQ